MRSISALLACVFLGAASAASADSRVFIVANQADGYGVDQCLAKGDKCGAYAVSHGHFGVGWGTSLRTAQAMSLKECGSNCRVVVAECE